MKGLKRIITKFDLSVFKKYFILSFIIIISVFILSRLEFTAAKYVTDTDVSLSPDFAFFIVNVSTQSATIRLDNMVPRDRAYEYTFQVSNFKGTEKANVDLTYSIEVISTTNLPLMIKLFKGTNTNQTPNYTETITANSDGVYFKHLLYSGVSTMLFNNRYTDTYTLWVQYPVSAMDEAEGNAGVIELIDVEIRAEQVVS